MTAVMGVAVLAVCGTAHPDHLTLVSTRSTEFEVTLSSVQATLSYTAESAAAGSLTVTVTNATTGIYPSGSVTAIALNMPPGVVASFAPSDLNDDDGPWSLAHPAHTPPSVGDFNTIITVDGGSFMGAGNGSLGLRGADEMGQGAEIGTFVFDIATGAGLDAAALSTLDFIAANDAGFGAAFKVKGLGAGGLGSEPNMAKGLVPNGGESAQGGDASGDAWWMMTASIDGTLVADTCGSASDPVLSVHAGGPGAPALPGDPSCAASSGDCDDGPCVSVAVGEGETYLVHAAAADPAAGPIVLDVEIMDTPCPWDLESDGIVSLADLLVVLGAWGANPGHPADFDADGTVGITDVVALFANWGVCP